VHASRSLLISLAIAAVCGPASQPRPASAESSVTPTPGPSLKTIRLSDSIMPDLPCPFAYPSVDDYPNEYRKFKDAGSLDAIARRHPGFSRAEIQDALNYLIYIGEAKRFGDGTVSIYHCSRSSGG